MRIVVTGGRDYDDWAMLQDILNHMNPKEVYVGDCPTGADKMALDWCELNRIRPTVFKADWNKFNKAAGPIRNTEMLEEAGSKALVIAFPGGRGTEHCVKTAVGLNMIVMRVEP